MRESSVVIGIFLLDMATGPRHRRGAGGQDRDVAPRAVREIYLSSERPWCGLSTRPVGCRPSSCPVGPAGSPKLRAGLGEPASRTSGDLAQYCYGTFMIDK